MIVGGAYLMECKGDVIKQALLVSKSIAQLNDEGLNEGFVEGVLKQA